MKEIVFKGRTLEAIRDFPEEARQQTGYELDRVQRGLEPRDWKPMKSVGLGVKEIRVRTEDGTFRAIYVARFGNTVYVLSAFQKKSQKTPKSHIDMAKRHYQEIEK
ncbi:type II toxin-antitoxin system RelE/ParE family toxin [Sedimenticola hydrogenitrophicus]|uniref:type II toxin-antitoxin system RelE/ParE family toxin n=1 Tax=Sedimenticola hydrogenitrophicus TaxID=2967975 RepID=UPI0023B0332B|nr:type II toxin-antitoxin system RelE/ParE family toxin [Sedimenticola hydrogenitrophicus]